MLSKGTYFKYQKGALLHSKNTMVHDESRKLVKLNLTQRSCRDVMWGKNADGTQEHVVRERAFKDVTFTIAFSLREYAVVDTHLVSVNTCCAVYIESYFFPPQSAPSTAVITKKCS